MSRFILSGQWIKIPSPIRVLANRERQVSSMRILSLLIWYPLVVAAITPRNLLCPVEVTFLSMHDNTIWQCLLQSVNTFGRKIRTEQT